MRPRHLAGALGVSMVALGTSAALLGSGPGCGGSCDSEPCPGITGAGAGPTSAQSTSSSGVVIPASSSSSAASSSGSGGCEPQDAGAGWETLPLLCTIEGCSGERLTDPSTWPKPIWQDCGPGCRVASAFDASEIKWAEALASAADAASDQIYYRTVSDSVETRYNILRTLSDDKAVLVTRSVHACYSGHSKESAPFVIEHNGGGMRWVSTYRSGADAFVTPSATFYASGGVNDWFSWEHGWGFLEGGSIKVVTDANPADLSAIFSGGGYLSSARARNGLVAWVDWGSFPAKIQSWTQETGTRVLFQAPADVAGLALGETTIAFVSVTGPNALQGGYETARLAWSPLTSDPASVQITLGPDISGLVAGGPITATAGDFIAIGTQDGADPATWGILVCQMSTQKVWRILPPAGVWFKPAGMNSTEVLAYEFDYDPLDLTYFERWKRFELARLDEYATPWP